MNESTKALHLMTVPNCVLRKCAGLCGKRGGNCQKIGSFHHLAGNPLPNPAHPMMSPRNAGPKDQVELVQAPEMISPLPTSPLPDDENHPISGRSPFLAWQVDSLSRFGLQEACEQPGHAHADGDSQGKLPRPHCVGCHLRPVGRHSEAHRVVQRGAGDERDDGGNHEQ